MLAGGAEAVRAASRQPGRRPLCRTVSVNPGGHAKNIGALKTQGVPAGSAAAAIDPVRRLRQAAQPARGDQRVRRAAADAGGVGSQPQPRTR